MTSKSVVFLTLGAGVLMGLLSIFRPNKAPTEVALTAANQEVQEKPASVANTFPPQSVLPAQKIFDLIIKNGKLVSGPSLLQVSANDQIVIRLHSDASDEFHLHGYDLEKRLTPNKTVEIIFKADRTGRFEFELHHAHGDLGALEVLPQ